MNNKILGFFLMSMSAVMLVFGSLLVRSIPDILETNNLSIGQKLIGIYLVASMIFVPWVVIFKKWIFKVSENHINKMASNIANATVNKLQDKGFDCVNRDSYGFLGNEIHTAILHSVKNELKNNREFIDEWS